MLKLKWAVLLVSAKQIKIIFRKVNESDSHHSQCFVVLCCLVLNESDSHYSQGFVVLCCLVLNESESHYSQGFVVLCCLVLNESESHYSQCFVVLCCLVLNESESHYSQGFVVLCCLVLNESDSHYSQCFVVLCCLVLNESDSHYNQGFVVLCCLVLNESDSQYSQGFVYYVVLFSMLTLVKRTLIVRLTTLDKKRKSGKLSCLCHTIDIIQLSVLLWLKTKLYSRRWKTTETRNTCIITSFSTQMCFIIRSFSQPSVQNKLGRWWTVIKYQVLLI